MIIKPSTSLRNEYSAIAQLAKETGEPIYITKNGEGDGVFMDIEAFERREQMLEMRARVLAAEDERIRGGKSYSINEVRAILEARRDEM